MMGNNQNLFFSPEEKGRAFSDVLKEVQEYISSKYSTLMVEGGNDEVKQQVKRYISKYIADYRITVKGKTREELIDDLYTEMAEFSFLTKYIFGTGIEEIDINSWRDIEVQYSDGRCEKMEEHFESPEHAINVIRRMLHVSGMVLDNASPAVLGHLSKNIRIAVLKTPLVDEDVGIAASIRIVNPQSLKKSDFVDGGTATDEMLDFLAECLRYGISICVAGATSSGKTTLAGWLLTTIPDNKRIFTIENGSRELALVREKDGKVTNSVIHTLTRFSENEKQSIDQDMLLDMALRFNPEIICVGEMRSSEASSGIVISNTFVFSFTLPILIALNTTVITLKINAKRILYARYPIPLISPAPIAINMVQISFAEPGVERKRTRLNAPATATPVPIFPLTIIITAQTTAGRMHIVIKKLFVYLPLYV